MSNYHEVAGHDRLTELFVEISETMGGAALQPGTETTTPVPTGFDAESTLNSLRWGMTINGSPLRDEISNRIADARTKWLANWYDPEKVWEADAIANSIHELPGIEVLQSSDHIANHNSRCAHYVFGERLGEPWALYDEKLDTAIWDDATSFLAKKGYIPTADPQPGDVVVYSSEEPQSRGLEWVEHFAILEEAGRAVSRFGQGPVVRHPIDAVPNQYGDKVYFFRKDTVDSEL